MVPGGEVLLCTPAVRNLIRKGDDHQLRSQLTMGRAEGMMTMEQSLGELVRAHGMKLSIEEGGDYVSSDLRFHQGLIAYLHGAVRAPSFPALLETFRGGQRRRTVGRRDRALQFEHIRRQVSTGGREGIAHALESWFQEALPPQEVACPDQRFGGEPAVCGGT